MPCKQAFPHLVEVHKKLAKKGLVVISVSLDALEDKEKALRFLQKVGANMTNLLLDEPVDLWQKKLDFVAPPSLFVFDRQGKWTRFRSDDDAIDYAKVDSLVEQLLQEK